MKEIGGFIEFENFDMPLRHENALALNCGRNCLSYLIRAKRISKLVLPYFLCSSVKLVGDSEGITVRYYHIDSNFLPVDVRLEDNEWLYIVNYYGQLSSQQILALKERYSNLIVDQAQSYFDDPIEGIDTLYTCRKFFGVPDGAFLYTDTKLESFIPTDKSFSRMSHLLGRFENCASDHYFEYVQNNELVGNEPLKKMSRLTMNLLRGIDYEKVKQKRTTNYLYLHENLSDLNFLKLHTSEGAFAYPLYLENGDAIRKELIRKKIYIPLLWPNVLNEVKPSTIEYKLANNVLPIPCDQRYGISEMEHMVKLIKELLG